MDPVVCYHGSHAQHLESFFKNGINRKDPSTGMVSVTLDPYTANAWAALSGVGGDRKAKEVGVVAPTTDHTDRVVIKFAIPKEWADKYIDRSLAGNEPNPLKHMMSKEMYDAYEGTDQSYYQFSELRFSEAVPPEFIVGYMTPP